MKFSNNISEQTAVIFEPVKLNLDHRFELPEFTKEIFIPVDPEVQLNAFLYEKPENRFLMIYFQGNAKNLQNFLDNHSMVFDWGYNILVSDYRSFGKSGGELNGQEQLYNDAEKIYEYAISLGYSSDQIILYGYSMGGAMAAYLAADRPAVAVIMESTYSSIDEREFSAGRCPEYELNNAMMAKRISMPALVIHGREDLIILKAHAERIWENLGSPVKEKFILAGGGHGDLRLRPEYKGLINNFINRLLK